LVIVASVWNESQIRYQVIVFNELTLLIAHVLGDHALAAEATDAGTSDRRPPE
jgi:hypothetical protein